MTLNFFKGQWEKYSFIKFTGFLFIVFIGLNASAETNILPGERIQPPTRFLWFQGGGPFTGHSEKEIFARESINHSHYASPQDALNSQRHLVCTSGEFVCHDNEESPGSNGWGWRFLYNTPVGAPINQAGSFHTSKHGICPVNLDPLNPPGYSIVGTPENVNGFGYIACPIPSQPDGEKDLAKPQECGERTPNPVHIGLGRKEITIPIYSTSSNAFPIDFQLYYHHNDEKRLGVTWRHTYYRFIVVDGQENPTSVRIYRGRGALVFNKDIATEQWHSDADINDKLTELVDSNNQRTGWVYLDRFADKIENYDLNGRLTSIIDKSGLTHTLSYNSNGNLTVITDAHGQQLQFTHDTKGNFSTLTDPAGGLYQFFYDEIHNNLISVTYPDGKVRTYHYNEPAYTSNTTLSRALTGITDENGVRYATYSYDTQGRAIITELAGGANRHMLAYSPDGSNTVVTDPLGSKYTHQFQNVLGVAKSIRQSQPAGAGCSAASSSTTYDVNGNVASRTDFNGNKTCFAFDLNRNIEIARVEGLAAGSVCPSNLVNYTPANAAERKILTNWHADFRLPTLFTEAQRETSINYDFNGNVTLLSIRDTASDETRTWKTSYVFHPTVPGVITQRIEDGPRTDVSDISTINYYAPDENCTGGHIGCRGQIASITNALGHVTYITRYNAHGQPEVIIDPNELNTTLDYDVRQRMISRTVGTEITNYQYDGVGQITRITFPDNSFLVYTYEDAHRLIEINDNLNNRIRYTLDAAGNRTTEEIFDATGALTQIRSQEFDALSRLWKTIGAQNQITELGYDPNGNLKEASDPLQNTTTSQFDALNRLIQITDPVGGQTQQDLNTLDQITRVTTGLVGNQPPPDPELQDREPPVPDHTGIDTTYTYNGLGDLLQEVSADRGTTTYTYDAAGNQITLTDARGVVETTTYDALNRQTGRTYVTVTGVPNIDPITWTYDADSNGIGRLTGMTDESGSTTYHYDQHGRLLNKTQNVKFGTRSFILTLSYQYDSRQRSADCQKYRYPITDALRDNFFQDLPAKCAAPAWADFLCRSR